MKQLIAFVGLCLVLYGCAGFGAFLDESDGKTAGSVTAGGTTTGGTTTGGTTTGGTTTGGTTTGGTTTGGTTTGGTTTGGTTTGGTTTGGTSGGTTYMETTLYQEDYERFKDSKDLIGYAWTGDSSEDDKISPIQLGKRSDGIPVEFGQQCSILYSLPTGGRRYFGMGASITNADIAIADMTGMEFMFRFSDSSQGTATLGIPLDPVAFIPGFLVHQSTDSWQYLGSTSNPRTGKLGTGVGGWHRIRIELYLHKRFTNQFGDLFIPFRILLDGQPVVNESYELSSGYRPRVHGGLMVASNSNPLIQASLLIDDSRIFLGMAAQ